MKVLITSIAAAAIALPAIAQQTTYYQSSSGSSAVRVSPGGYGFAGEIDANGNIHGIDTNGVPLNGAVLNGAATNGGPFHGASASGPGVTFFNADNPAAFNANVPFVRMDNFGRIGVDMRKNCLPSSGDVGLPAANRSRTALAMQLCREGRLEDAYRLYESSELGDGPLLLDPKAASMIAFRNYKFDEAAAIARSLMEHHGADAVLWAWDDLRVCYSAESDYLADWGVLRSAVPNASTRFLAAVHSQARGRTDIAHAELTSLLNDSPTDVLARLLLMSLPPIVD